MPPSLSLIDSTLVVGSLTHALQAFVWTSIARKRTDRAAVCPSNVGCLQQGLRGRFKSSRLNNFHCLESYWSQKRLDWKTSALWVSKPDHLPARPQRQTRVRIHPSCLSTCHYYLMVPWKAQGCLHLYCGDLHVAWFQERQVAGTVLILKACKKGADGSRFWKNWDSNRVAVARDDSTNWSRSLDHWSHSHGTRAHGSWRCFSCNSLTRTSPSLIELIDCGEI